MASKTVSMYSITSNGCSATFYAGSSSYFTRSAWPDNYMDDDLTNKGSLRPNTTSRNKQITVRTTSPTFKTMGIPVGAKIEKLWVTAQRDSAGSGICYYGVGVYHSNGSELKSLSMSQKTGTANQGATYIISNAVGMVVEDENDYLLFEDGFMLQNTGVFTMYFTSLEWEITYSTSTLEKVRHGSSEVPEMYVGSSKASAAYLGTNKL